MNVYVLIIFVVMLTKTLFKVITLFSPTPPFSPPTPHHPLPSPFLTQARHYIKNKRTQIIL